MGTEKLENRLHILQYVVITLLLIVIIVPFVWTWWLTRQLPVVSTVSIDNVQLVSPGEVCPGDALVITYDFHAKGAGILVRDWTLWNVDPPKTVIFSAARRFILDGPIDQELMETWHIPRSYLNHETEAMEPLPPGRYRRYLAISSPSRSTVVAITAVDFYIRSDCNDKQRAGHHSGNHQRPGQRHAGHAGGAGSAGT